MARIYRKVHEPLLITFLAKTFPPGTWRTNVRLGKVNEDFFPEYKIPELKNTALNYLPRADAVVLLKDKVIICEVMTRNEFWKLEQLDEYARLFKITEEFKDYWDLPIEKWLITPKYNRYLEERAIQHGIKLVIHSEVFWEAYASLQRGRDREGRFNNTIIPPPPFQISGG
jgi:hypothetical protein